MNWGIIITIEILEISNIEIIVIIRETHLGARRKSFILPVIVQRAMAIIIEAKNNINISFKLHKINTDIAKAEIDSKVVVFNLNN